MCLNKLFISGRNAHCLLGLGLENYLTTDDTSVIVKNSMKREKLMTTRLVM